MIVIIQCAATKNPNAGFLQTQDGKKVVFVAAPESSPPDSTIEYARPDDLTETGKSWRGELLTYNAIPSNNPFDLLPAWRLYRNPVYAALVEKYGVKNVFILSAGWGLIASDFLTPAYDITFSQSAAPYKKRRKNDHYQDFRMLPQGNEQPIVFIGGKDYMDLFCELTRNANAARFAFYNSARVPSFSHVTPVRFETTTRTNWHYQCAKALIRGDVRV